MRSFDQRMREPRNRLAGSGTSGRLRCDGSQLNERQHGLMEGLNRRSAVVSQLQIQRALDLGSPNDLHEQEAERVAGQVVRQISRGGTVAPVIEKSIRTQEGNGRPLASPVQKSMENQFGADFSDVKVHVDAQADQLSRALNARALTTGNDIFFKKGEYDPGSLDGQELIAHELTHVVQQDGAAQDVRRQSDGFPNEITSHIASFLDPKSLHSFMRTSKTNLALGANFDDLDTLYKRLCKNGVSGPVVRDLPPRRIGQLANYIRANKWRNYQYVEGMINKALWENGMQDLNGEGEEVVRKCVNHIRLGCVDLSGKAATLSDLEIVFWGLTHVPKQFEVDLWVAGNLEWIAEKTGPMEIDEETAGVQQESGQMEIDEEFL